MSEPHQKLPRSGPGREALRRKGQFWTPDWVAEAMVAYVVAGGHDGIFDPAVGAGAFFRAAKDIGAEIGRNLKLSGREIDPHALEEARQSGGLESDLAGVEVRDFVRLPPKGPFKGIVANPPYIRHHRLHSEVKAELKALGAAVVGAPLDGRAGLHVYFLLRALQLLDKGGRLAFIIPADTCEGVFAPTLWEWITRNYRLEAVVTFSPEASPFPEVDTNPMILMLRNVKPERRFLWVKCTKAETEELKAWVLSGFNRTPGAALLIRERELSEGLATGLSRPPAEGQPGGPTLGHLAAVKRGIATGANDFFFLTASQARSFGIPDEFLIPAVGRTRDVPGDGINLDTVRELEAAGRPTLLFSPGGRALHEFPEPVRQYLRRGEAMGLHRRPLISTRRPWYKMELRPPPPILFAYLGRRNARFILNTAAVVPLTAFLCVYPHEKDLTSVHKLWRVLCHPATVANLWQVGKSYGGGAIKVEPRALEKLPLPVAAVSRTGLRTRPKATQLQLQRQE